MPQIKEFHTSVSHHDQRRFPTQPLLSVVIPVYNEQYTVLDLLSRVAAGPYAYPEMEVIVVDDGSDDATPGMIDGWADRPGFRVIHLPVNSGKGTAVRMGFTAACGEIVLIQDADLEYDPGDYPKLLAPILAGKTQVVYGSRYMGSGRLVGWTKFRVAVVMLNAAVRVLYGRRLTDEATCYKVFRRSLLIRLNLTAEKFELCPEITAKLCRLGLTIHEVPISYSPRAVKDGKKIGWRDAVSAFFTLLKWRFRSWRPADEKVSAEPRSEPGG